MKSFLLRLAAVTYVCLAASIAYADDDIKGVTSEYVRLYEEMRGRRNDLTDKSLIARSDPAPLKTSDLPTPKSYHSSSLLDLYHHRRPSHYFTQPLSPYYDPYYDDTSKLGSHAYHGYRGGHHSSFASSWHPRRDLLYNYLRLQRYLRWKRRHHRHSRRRYNRRRNDGAGSFHHAGGLRFLLDGDDDHYYGVAPHSQVYYRKPHFAGSYTLGQVHNRFPFRGQPAYPNYLLHGPHY